MACPGGVPFRPGGAQTPHIPIVSDCGSIDPSYPLTPYARLNPRTECTLAQITHSEEHGIFKFEIIDLRQHATSAQELSHAKGVPLGLSACPRRGLGAFYGGWGGTVPCGTCDGGRARVRGCLHCAAATSASQQAAAPRKTQSDARRLSTVMPPRAQGQAFRPCTASERVRGSWTGDRYTVRGEHADGRAHGGAVRNHGLRHGAPSSRSAQRRRSTACVARTWWSLGTLWHVGCILSSQPRMATREEEKRRCLGAAHCHWGLAPCSGTIRSSLITRSAQCKCPWPMPHFTWSGKPVSLRARYLNSTGGSSPIKHGRAVGSS